MPDPLSDNQKCNKKPVIENQNFIFLNILHSFSFKFYTANSFKYSRVSCQYQFCARPSFNKLSAALKLSEAYLELINSRKVNTIFKNRLWLNLLFEWNLNMKYEFPILYPKLESKEFRMFLFIGYKVQPQSYSLIGVRRIKLVSITTFGLRHLLMSHLFQFE